MLRFVQKKNQLYNLSLFSYYRYCGHHLRTSAHVVQTPSAASKWIEILTFVK